MSSHSNKTICEPVLGSRQRKNAKMEITQRARHVIAHGHQPPETLTLTPPLAEDFSVYGTIDTTARARSWALGNRYLLCGGVAECAHGLYLMDGCPGRCREAARLDHVNLWVPSEIGEATRERAFILYHPYLKQLEEHTYAYAKAHGLEVEVGRPGDDWYGSGTLAVRLTIPYSSALWPLERDALGLLGNISFFWSEEEERVPEE